jgi:hypothetical protein
MAAAGTNVPIRSRSEVIAREQFSGQNQFALEPFPRDSQVRPVIELAMG